MKKLRKEDFSWECTAMEYPLYSVKFSKLGFSDKDVAYTYGDILGGYYYTSLEINVMVNIQTGEYISDMVRKGCEVLPDGLEEMLVKDFIKKMRKLRA